MQNGQKTIRELFDGSKIFNIPEYQRTYAWEEKQLKDFVDDIKNQNRDKDYFFGTILFQEKKEISNNFEIIDIVDGQQRITTLIIFMNLLLNELKGDMNDNDISILKDRYIQVYGEYKLRVLQDDNDFFKSYILEDKPIDEVGTPSQKRLLKAKKFLNKQIENEEFEALREFTKKIESMKILTYSVEGNAEATLIFETTNDRGKSLTNLEKIKSFLMYKTYLASSDLPETRLNDIQHRFSEIYRNYEKIEDRVDEDTILQYHSIAFEKWAKKSEYQNYVPKIKQQVNELVNNLDTESKARNFIERYSLELKESFVFMRKLLQNREPYLLDIFALDRPAVFYPLLIKAYKFDESTGKQNFKRVARLVEIICFRFSIERSRSDNGREKLYRMARDFNQDFEELIKDLKRFIDNHCYDYYFSSHLSLPNFYSELKSNYQQYLFWKYENYLRRIDQPIFPEMSYDEFANRNSRTKYSIERIIPYNPQYSKVVEDQSILPEMTREFQKNYLGYIGNLTIDPLSANSSKSNHSFDYKNQNYFRKAPLKMQNELDEFLNPETGKWDEVSIQERGAKILDFALKYWDHKEV